MMVSKGNAKSLGDVVIKFLDFAQESSYNTQAWELVDDRLDSFYGATLRVPVKKKINNIICGALDASVLHGEAYYYTTSGALNSNVLGSPLVPYDHQYFLPTVANSAYPTTRKYLDEMCDILSNMPNHGTLIIQLYEGFMPSSAELFSFGADATDDMIYDAWENLLRANKQYNSDNICALILSGGFRLEDFSSMTSADYISSFAHAQYSALDRRIFNLFAKYDYCIIDFSNAILTKFPTISAFSSCLCSDSTRHYFNDAFSDFITDEIDTVIKAQDSIDTNRCQYFYVSFQHTDVDSTTYSKWLRSGSRVGVADTLPHSKRLFDTQHIEYFRGSEGYDHTGFYDGRYSMVKNTTKYSGGNNDNVNFNTENLFKNSGEFVAVGLHTHFDYWLWMSEQGGVTCEKEFSRIDYSSNAKSYIGLIPIERYTVNKLGGYNDVDISAPLFPGTGCPWFCKSTQDNLDYAVVENGVDYWFTKDDYCATITVRLSNNHNVPDAYQTMSFGFLDNITSESYKFPLYVCGGSQGISHDIWVRTRYHGLPTYTAGNVYDLSIRNPSGGGNNALYPTRFNGSNSSNFKVLSPEGIWENIFGLQQVASVVHYGSCGVIYNWGYPLQKLSGVSDQYNSAIPFSSYPYDSVADTYRVGRGTDDFMSSSVYGRFMICLSDLGLTRDNGFQGIIPNMGYSFSRQIPFGEVELSGKKYLCIPNGWGTKLKFYNWHVGRFYNDEWDTSQLRDEFDSLVNVYKNNIFNGRILIPLEDL